MELLIVILNKEEYFEKLISLLVESGARGATIADSEGVGHFLAHEIPIFAGIRRLVGEGKSVNKTILSVIDNKDIFIRFKELLAEEGIDFTKPGVGVIATIPVNEVVRSDEELE